MKVSINQLLDYYKGNHAIKIRETLIDKSKFIVFYVESLIDLNELEKHYLPKMEELLKTNQTKNNILTLEKVKNDNYSEFDQKLFAGFVVIYYKKDFYSFKLVSIPKRGPTPTINDVTTVGAQDCFVENIDTNIGLLLYRYRNNKLKVYETQLGKDTQTRACLIYLEGKIDDKIVKEAKKRMENLQIDMAININQIQNDLVNSTKNCLFPLIASVFKPDFCINYLEKGKFVILVDGIPVASVGPATLESIISFHYSSQENIFTTMFEKTMTYLCLFLSIFLAGFIAAVVSYHPSFVPYLLLSNIYSTSKGVFLSFPAQMFLAEILFQIFRLAGSKLPSHLGSTIIILGSLVVSRIGVETGLFSPYVLIIISLVIIANYGISNNSSFNVGFTLFRIFIGISSLLYGLIGFAFSSLITLIYLFSLDSFGVPYLYPYAPLNIKKAKGVYK